MIDRILESEGYDIRYSKGGEEVQMDCPFCGDSKKHLYISTIKGAGHCFKCGWSGSHSHLLLELKIADNYIVARQMLSTGKTDILDYQSILDKLQPRQQTITQHTEMPSWFIPFSAGHLSSFHAKAVFKYALSRMRYADILKYGVGYGTHEKYMWRLIFPVERDYWQGRVICKDVPRKYINPTMDLEDRLFNSKALNGRHLYIAEGILSAIALGDEAVAVLGKEVTQMQMHRITRYSNANLVTIAFDSGTSTSAQVITLAEELAACGKQVIVRNYKDGDPDDGAAYEDVEYSRKYAIAARFARKQPRKSFASSYI